ncbi:MAG: acyl-CoA dehydratase activase-related protein, partial [Flavobacteriales bacterium]
MHNENGRPSGGKTTRFKGFDVGKSSFTIDKFTCKSKWNDKKEPCSNCCEIQRVRIEGEKRPLFYGGRCEKFEVSERKGKGEGIPNLFHDRMKLLMGDFKNEEKNGRISIGIPRGLTIYYQYFPFWRTFFNELGFHLVLSKTSDRPLISKSLELANAETCFPVELMHGHVYDLLENDVDFVFAPFIVNQEADKDNPTSNCNCPWVQTYPFMVRTAVGAGEYGEKLLIPTLHFRLPGTLKKEISAFMKAQ